MNRELAERLELEARYCGMTAEEYVERVILLKKQTLLLPHIEFIRIAATKGKED
jgi:hypothetical protein